ncbi:MFS transporter [Pelotomaculum terephthalicicum JT]|uniref:MFS transporter n=1 Tax=Pelotomaculum TaxID=191373 RepID=UPI0009D33498|nr:MULTISPECIES: MFS transporter [Pelotomaculum]MCG9967730.1 MFS transporter [Pelotomaculum terephthalicicum JT]OPX85348.1 MAG: Inner membrane metabolite transport protein YhjE [Pelotomaculum sp. PtaB.Bin117]OPY62719.1 MAG: Inner membrane metabolite transport protein YhjE [Pelotomaculum sp. PtaU1.Bin065]
MNSDIATSTNVKPVSKKTPPEAKAAIKGAFLGFFIDMFDIYLPVICLAPAMVYFLPKDLPVTTTNTLFYITLAVTLLGRPLGAVIFGHFGDKIGRKKSSLISVAGFAVMTLLIGVLPGYQTLGLAAGGLLLAFRFIDGIFLGGQYSTAVPLAMEYAPKSKRGLYGGIIQSGFPVAYILVSIITSFMLKYMPAGGLDSPYIQYGWRIPFVAGFFISLGYLWFYYKNVEESKSWEKTEKVKIPLVEVLSGESLRNFLQVFILMNGLFFLANSILFAIPGILINILKMPAFLVTNVMMGVYVVDFFAYIIGGALSQIIGRRKLFIITGVLSCTILPYIYYLVVKYGTTMGSFALFVCISILIAVTFGGSFSFSMPYINERFKTSIRSSGFGMGYSFGVIIPSFYSFYMLALKGIVPYEYTQIVLQVLGGVLTVIGAAMGPETKDIDLGPS